MANRLLELPRVTDAVTAFLEGHQTSPTAIESVQLALDELVSNVILWGYEDGLEHRLEVSVEVEPKQVRLVIRDDGRPFDPWSLPPPDTHSAPEQRREGGLGVHLVRTMAEEVKYRRVNGRNVLEVRIAAE